MILYYSGATSGESLPERILCDKRMGVMLTYWEMHGQKGDTTKRFERHSEQRLAKLEKKKNKKRKNNKS